jgi:hypothetical protein
MYYDIRNQNSRQKLIQDSELEGDDCPVDDICDSIPLIIRYVQELEDKLRNYKNINVKISADLGDAQRKINNLKSQTHRRFKKKEKERKR